MLETKVFSSFLTVLIGKSTKSENLNFCKVFYLTKIANFGSSFFRIQILQFMLMLVLARIKKELVYTHHTVFMACGLSSRDMYFLLLCKVFCLFSTSRVTAAGSLPSWLSPHSSSSSSSSSSKAPQQQQHQRRPPAWRSSPPRTRTSESRWPTSLASCPGQAPRPGESFIKPVVLPR